MIPFSLSASSSLSPCISSSLSSTLSPLLPTLPAICFYIKNHISLPRHRTSQPFLWTISSNSFSSSSQSFSSSYQSPSKLNTKISSPSSHSHDVSHEDNGDESLGEEEETMENDNENDNDNDNDDENDEEYENDNSDDAEEGDDDTDISLHRPSSSSSSTSSAHFSILSRRHFKNSVRPLEYFLRPLSFTHHLDSSPPSFTHFLSSLLRHYLLQINTVKGYGMGKPLDWALSENQKELRKRHYGVWHVKNRANYEYNIVKKILAEIIKKAPNMFIRSDNNNSNKNQNLHRSVKILDYGGATGMNLVASQHIFGAAEIPISSYVIIENNNFMKEILQETVKYVEKSNENKNDQVILSKIKLKSSLYDGFNLSTLPSSLPSPPPNTDNQFDIILFNTSISDQCKTSEERNKLLKYLYLHYLNDNGVIVVIEDANTAGFRIVKEGREELLSQYGEGKGKGKETPPSPADQSVKSEGNDKSNKNKNKKFFKSKNPDGGSENHQINISEEKLISLSAGETLMETILSSHSQSDTNTLQSSSPSSPSFPTVATVLSPCGHSLSCPMTKGICKFASRIQWSSIPLQSTVKDQRASNINYKHNGDGKGKEEGGKKSVNSNDIDMSSDGDRENGKNRNNNRNESVGRRESSKGEIIPVVSSPTDHSRPSNTSNPLGGTIIQEYSYVVIQKSHVETNKLFYNDANGQSNLMIVDTSQKFHADRAKELLREQEMERERERARKKHNGRVFHHEKEIASIIDSVPRVIKIETEGEKTFLLPSSSSSSTSSSSSSLLSVPTSLYNSPFSRVISPPLNRSTHILVDLCTPAGHLERWTFPKKMKLKGKLKTEMIRIKKIMRSNPNTISEKERVKISSWRINAAYYLARNTNWGDMIPFNKIFKFYYGISSGVTAINHYPTGKDLHQHRGEIYWRTGDEEREKEKWEREANKKEKEKGVDTKAKDKKIDLSQKNSLSEFYQKLQKMDSNKERSQLQSLGTVENNEDEKAKMTEKEDDEDNSLEQKSEHEKTFEDLQREQRANLLSPPSPPSSSSSLPPHLQYQSSLRDYISTLSSSRDSIENEKIQRTKKIHMDGKDIRSQSPLNRIFGQKISSWEDGERDKREEEKQRAVKQIQKLKQNIAENHIQKSIQRDEMKKKIFSNPKSLPHREEITREMNEEVEAERKQMENDFSMANLMLTMATKEGEERDKMIDKIVQKSGGNAETDNDEEGHENDEEKQQEKLREYMDKMLNDPEGKVEDMGESPLHSEVDQMIAKVLREKTKKIYKEERRKEMEKFKQEVGKSKWFGKDYQYKIEEEGEEEVPFQEDSTTSPIDSILHTPYRVESSKNKKTNFGTVRFTSDPNRNVRRGSQ